MRHEAHTWQVTDDDHCMMGQTLPESSDLLHARDGAPLGARGHVKLRDDLVVSQQNTAAGAVFVLKDPQTGRLFRFREPEYFILRQLDGRTPLEVIQRQTEEKFSAALPPHTLAKFITTVQRAGLFQGEHIRPGHFDQRGRVRGSFLYVRLRAFDPDRLFARLLPRVRFFFTPYFIVPGAFLILLAFLITFLSWNEILRDGSGLFRIQTFLLAWLISCATITAHEFAHGLTCKRFGGEVHELGFMLIYFQPAFYCNVSDTWLFPEKSKRLWVTFAGPYLDFVGWAAATLIWRVTEPETTLHYFSLVVMGLSAIRMFFNLNPLIKLDGYYLLSDALEMPNLRQKAFSYLGARIRAFWGSSSPVVWDTSRRERRIYLTYGLLAGLYSYALLATVAFSFGSYFIRQYQGFGLVLFATLLVGLVGNPLRKLRREPYLPADAAAVGGARDWPRFARAQRRTRRSLRKRGLVLAAILAGLAVLVFGKMELTVSGPFTVLPLENADVRTKVSGLLEHIYVDEGDSVKAGQLIARLSDRDYRAELRKTDAAIAEKRAKLRMLKVGARREEIDLARKTVATARTRLDQAQKRHDEAKRMLTERLTRAEVSVSKGDERLRYARVRRDLFETLQRRELVSWLQSQEAQEAAAVREKELEETRAELKLLQADDLADLRKAIAVAENELKEAESKLTLVLAGSRQEEVEGVEAEIARLEVERRHLEETLRRLAIVSPITGVITTPKLKERVGEHVPHGALITKVHELKTLKAQIAVSEKEIADARLGQLVVLKARAVPEETFSGRVISISPTATKADDTLGQRTVFIITEIDNSLMRLRPEMSGHAKTYCGTRRIGDLIARRVARYVTIEFWSWW
jgi:putative peptide zinc metalloprotease protein